MSITGLPEFSFQFNTDSIGEVTGEKFTGSFTYVRPNIRSLSDIGRYEAALNGNSQGLEPNVRVMNKVLANLRYTLTDYPKWWLESGYGIDLYDLNVVLEIYVKCDEFERKFEKKVEEAAQKKLENT